MPARRTSLDPSRSPLEAFANDLRALGRGNISLPYITEHTPDVSRAALYAALTGRRVPSERTLSALLRWWIGGVEAGTEYAGEFESGTPNPYVWDWVNRWASDDKMALIDELAGRREELTSREDRTQPTKPVEIPVPPEQERFIESLHAALLDGGLLEDEEPAGWYEARRGQERKAERIQRYLQGKCIPTDKSLIELLVGVTRSAQLETLLELAAEARTARVRDRRAARSSRRP